MKELLETILDFLGAGTSIRVKRLLWLRLIPLFEKSNISCGEYLGRDVGYDQAYDLLHPAIDLTTPRKQLEFSTDAATV
jgi:hypothetical protein